jgi:hypothetical protein
MVLVRICCLILENLFWVTYGGKNYKITEGGKIPIATLIQCSATYILITCFFTFFKILSHYRMPLRAKFIIQNGKRFISYGCEKCTYQRWVDCYRRPFSIGR